MSEPDIQLDGLSVWVRRREFPDATDFHDANWLVVRATMLRGETSVSTEGAILMTTDFERFRAGLAAMYDSLGGEAELSGYEPNLKVKLDVGRLGHVSGRVEITPNDLGERHWFEMDGWDQTYLPKLIGSCDAILTRFPVVDRRDA